MTTAPLDPPVLDHVCGFCSRQVFTDGTISMVCGYCPLKTRAEIESELRPWKSYLSDIDLLAFYGGIGPDGTVP